MRKPLRQAVRIAALVLLMTGPALAQVDIVPGLDAFDTANGTSFTLTVPPDYFCPNSTIYTATVDLLGNPPLSTNPNGTLGSADTVIELLAGAHLEVDGECADIPIVVRAFKAVSAQNLKVTCPGGDTFWRVDVCTCGCCCGVQPITMLNVCMDDQACGCGHFTGELKIDVCLRFTNVADGTVLGPLQDTVSFQIAGMSWCKGLSGALMIPDPFVLDTDCDQMPDLAVPGTTNFHPGANCGSPCPPPPECHEGPDHLHCVQGTCKGQTG